MNIRTRFRVWITGAILIALGWIALLLTSIRDFLRGDNSSGVMALIIGGSLIAAAGVGFASYRRYQAAWKQRVEERRQEVQ